MVSEFTSFLGVFFGETWQRRPDLIKSAKAHCSSPPLQHWDGGAAKREKVNWQNLICRKGPEPCPSLCKNIPYWQDTCKRERTREPMNMFIHSAQSTCSRRVSNDRWSGLILFASVVAKWRRYRHQQRGAQLALDTVSILVKKAKTVSDNATYYICTFSDVGCTLYSVAALGKYPHYCWIQAISGSQLFVDNCNTCDSYLSSGFWLCNLTQR